MRVLHIQTDKIFAKEVRDIVEKNGFSYTCIWFRADMDEILDKVLEDHKYNFIIVDECISSLSVEHLINKVNAKGVIRPSIVVISSQHDFNTKKYYFQLGIMAFFNKKDFDRNRFEKYLQTVKYDIEMINFLKNFHIAVIDDSKLSLNIIKNNFSSSGIFDVDYYQDSAKFLKCTQKYDLFLIDLLMPIYDGETLTNYIREKDHEAIIILITAYNNGQIIPHCLSIGADDFMIKPFDYNLFMLRIHSCISRYKMRKELIIKNRKLFDLAIKDNLTGIYNRTYFTDIYKKK
ncbi:response regulator transcription factor [Pectinatus sottacetonis]|uniref:response regulator transcription factor n=1 Tax=Pectinatus sottacetonis TaxID=1002795 RepID=UPI0018C60AC1|nr:response regulator [Pectinatus sottacetonis]